MLAHIFEVDNTISSDLHALLNLIGQQRLCEHYPLCLSEANKYLESREVVVESIIVGIELVLLRLGAIQQRIHRRVIVGNALILIGVLSG